jgi:Citrate lyase beta subunit
MRTALFVPATHPDRIDKALASGADEVIVDLEDAVAADQKDRARDNLRTWLDQATLPVMVRINAVGQSAYAADIALCRNHARVSGIVLPKAESGEDVFCLGAEGKRIWPLIESAAGLSRLAEIAATDGVERLVAGFLDMALDLGWNYGTPGTEIMLDRVRYELVLQSRLNGLAQPVDGVYPDIGDTEGLARNAVKIRDMGFAGMLAIHPKQVSVIHEAMQPSEEEIAWAERVIAAAENSQGAFALDGAMVDAPVIAKAGQVLARRITTAG